MDAPEAGLPAHWAAAAAAGEEELLAELTLLEEMPQVAALSGSIGVRGVPMTSVTGWPELPLFPSVSSPSLAVGPC